MLMQKFGGTSKEYYGIFESGLFFLRLRILYLIFANTLGFRGLAVHFICIVGTEHNILSFVVLKFIDNS